MYLLLLLFVFLLTKYLAMVVLLSTVDFTVVEWLVDKSMFCLYIDFRSTSWWEKRGNKRTYSNGDEITGSCLRMETLS